MGLFKIVGNACICMLIVFLLAISQVISPCITVRAEENSRELEFSTYNEKIIDIKNNVLEDSDLIVENEEIKIETVIHNTKLVEINRAKIEYFTKSKLKPIKVVNIDKILAGESINTYIDYYFNKAGRYTIEVKVSGYITKNSSKLDNNTIKEDNIKIESNSSVDIKVSKMKELSKVVVQQGYNNGVKSDDNLKTLKNIVKENGMKLVLNENVLSNQVLSEAKLLILTQEYINIASQVEINLITKYISGGGNLIITSSSDIYDENSNCEYAKKGNHILEAIGAKIRLNDDQAIDNDINDGENYNLSFNKYNIESELLVGIDVDKKFKFFNGSTLIIPSSSDNIEVLIEGHESTYGHYYDKQNDNVSVNKGDVGGLAIETLDNNSKIVISGTNFYYEDEISDSNFSNYEITNMLLRYLAPVPKIELSSILSVKIDKNSDNILDKLGEKVIIEGYVTVASKAESNSNLFNNVIYVQDDTSGIEVYGVIESKVKLGQKVRVTGRVSSKFGNAQIKLQDENYDLQIIDERINLILPIEFSTFDSMQEKNEGMLVKTIGKVTSIVENIIYINDGSGEAVVYIDNFIENSIKCDLEYEWKSKIKVGDVISIVGIVVEGTDGYLLLVRDLAEIVNISDEIQEDIENEEIPELGEKPEVDVNPEVDINREENIHSELNKEKEHNNISNEEIEENTLSQNIDKYYFFFTIALIIVSGNIFTLFKSERY